MDYDRLVGAGARPYRIFGWFVIWLALIVALSTFAGMHGWPWRFSELQKYLLRHPRDNWLYNAFSIYSLRDGSIRDGSIRDGDARKTTRIVYVGGSVCLEGIPSDDWMSNALTDRLNRPVRFVSICSPYQNFGDEARIAHALGAFNGMLILGTEPVFFAKLPGRQFQARPGKGKQGGNGYFYLPIPAHLRRIAHDEGLNINVLSDVRQFWRIAPRALRQATARALREGPTSLRRHRIREYRDLDYENVANKFIKKYWISVNINDAFRRETIRTATRSGNRVALVEMPNDEALLGLFDPIRTDYRQRVERIVEDFSVDYLVPQSRSTWTKRDFFDTHHLSPTGREKFASILADLLVPLIVRDSVAVSP
jgi:hypothetical protein